MKAILVGTGPSLEQVDLQSLKGTGYIVAVKEAMTLFDFWDVAVSADWKWPLRKGKREQLLPVAKAGRLWFTDTCRDWMAIPGTQFFKSDADNSGAAALDFVRDFAEIETYGFDYRHIDGKHHAFGLNPWYSNKSDENLRAWAKNVS